MNQFLVDIALPIPLDRSFTYLVPPELQTLACVGNRALVPFGRKHLTGVIVALPTATEVRGLKPVSDILDTKPTFSPEMLALTKWIAEYYLAPWGEVLRASLPQGINQASTVNIRFIGHTIESLIQKTQKSAPRQHAILKALASGNSFSLSQLQARLKIKGIYSVLHEMQSRNWISLEESIQKQKVKPQLKQFVQFLSNDPETLIDEKRKLTTNQVKLIGILKEELSGSSSMIEVHSLLKRSSTSLSTLHTLAKYGILQINRKEVFRQSEFEPDESPSQITLNVSQKDVLCRIIESIQRGNFHAFLLHGVTGSGKTQVYIEAIRHILSIDKTAIVLVPEISLTPQTVRRFKAHFGQDVAVMHSQLSVGERYDSWRMAHQGKVKIVIGPRSAIFAPLENVGLIVVDEEHDSSYKQFDASPRYNARDVALVRASHLNAVVVLGSATPSAESYANAQSGKYTILELPQRVDKAQLPTIDIVDMAKERREVFEEIKSDVKKSGKEFPKRLPYTSISRLLKRQIASRLERKEGIILLQNRRGFSHVVECFECGYVEKCDNCEVSLTFHATKKHLRCHYCGFVKRPPTICPKCGNTDLRMHSFGTQQVQQELQELFPQATILRMDKDTTSRKGMHDKILKQFGMGDADILLGTQMVAKGLDFPRVTLVGVISADTQMLLPDFRASEETFQLLTQVAGRAGRSNLAGEVVIQTMQPDHYSLKHVATHNFQGFYREELEYRRELDYPPFSRIVLVEFSGERENDVQHHAKKFSEFLSLANRQKRFFILGPADAAILKIKNVYRKHIMIKDIKTTDPSGTHLRSALITAKNQYEASPLFRNRNIKMIIDVDPQGMM